ncbi:hypothetical protein [Aureibacter tunicatorum]|uniref:Uncharacterized protein n=1 Tax=Aureibacter tunicatorum TaxID=866807 RepID=A0AAE3XJ51_9BACT|nr:hypothetical protein [Aureibacter tunicatorum]MDR6237693.1 hypothetical protein [Aureibacter tunicatorum]BDD02728.1 hypothetical protein AUTU_02110 [Aureibacter tunicatorum]
MPKEISNALIQLINSLTKSEKRYFKLHSLNIKSNEKANFMLMFDHIDRNKSLDEKSFLKKNPHIKSGQISNIKAHLYKQVLKQLRGLNSDNDHDLQIRALIDESTILYNKCLYKQSIKLLRKAKKMAQSADKTILLLHILEQEKKLAMKLIRPDIAKQVTQLSAESEQIQRKIGQVYQFSNLYNKFYSLYLNTGFIRNAAEYDKFRSMFVDKTPEYNEADLSADEKMYLYSAMVSYLYYVQEFDKGLDYANKWVRLFDEYEEYKVPKVEMYIKGINNQLLGHYKKRQFEQFMNCLSDLENIRNLKGLTLTENISLQLFKYTSTHKINYYFLRGDFTNGVEIIQKIQEELQIHSRKLDRHNIMVFYYKFACMYIGNSEYSKAAHWLNKIINNNEVDLRADIQGFARILNLICHYEMENVDLVEYYIRSTYRFLIKKEDINFYQRNIMKFLRKLMIIQKNELDEAFKELLSQMLELKEIPFERRAFIYFDIISWLESKINKVPVQKVIQEKIKKKMET